MKVLTIGTFDLLHVGHKRLFKRASHYGPLTVGVNTCSFVSSYKGEPPTHNLETRMRSIKKVEGVSQVVTSHGSGIELIQVMRPDLLVVGMDWMGETYPRQLGTSSQELQGLVGGILFLPRTPGVSTTSLKTS